MSDLFLSMSLIKRSLCIALLCLLPVASAWAGGGFLAAASPSRFELRAEPGTVVRQILTIHNLGVVPVQYNIRSSEWDFTEQGKSIYSDALKPGSCRPWLRMERHKISVGGQGQRKFRFELHVPAETPPQECRLAIFIEGDGDAVTADAGSGMKLPVKGRLAIIVYLAIGGVEPKLTVNGIRRQQDGQYVFQVANSGKATGRLSGLLRGSDARGTEYDVSVSTLPVLPGQTRDLGLAFSLPSTKRKQPPTPAYPVRLKGELFWYNQGVKVDTTLK